ncbi:hypothetical protein [Variovorax paradoxus]|uniref:hypothetical protein n=1 Tax=Variovorax paradoxus TaxID=34073 RepID=UPI0029C81ED4|nr:hypothetical protein [Variovorax paradoxus]WPH19862.1 hypothetical protein RZE78_22955 [Variovorax paradoxus]
MPRLDSALKRLAEGCFVCEAKYSDEYEALLDMDGRAEAERWLDAIGYRLARLNDEGAFFMAHAVATTEMRTQFREELKSVRGKLEPVVAILESIRQAQGRNPQIHSGDMLWESELSEVIRQSSTLERRVLEMRDINGARVGESSNERVRRMLVQLEAEGYLVETNPTTRGYKVTGKIDYLYQLIEFIASNTAHLSDDDVVDEVVEQLRIDTPAAESDAAAPAAGEASTQLDRPGEDVGPARTPAP